MSGLEPVLPVRELGLGQRSNAIGSRRRDEVDLARDLARIRVRDCENLGHCIDTASRGFVSCHEH